MVQCKDLYVYLGLPPGAPKEHALYALEYRKGQLEALAHDPRYRPSAEFLFANYDALARVLADPNGHAEEQRKQEETARLPMLEMAVDGILSDGRVTDEELAYVERAALSLGISSATFRRVLEERALQAGVTLEVSAEPEPEASVGEIRGAPGLPWWDAALTRTLLDLIPGGPGEMLDLYCRSGFSAVTLLPMRPQLSFVGLDRDPQRIDTAREATSHLAPRVRFEVGETTRIPLEDESVDYVLLVRALESAVDTSLVFSEVHRVLRPGGRVIAVEPDGVSESFYFNEHLIAYNAAFRWLCKRVDDSLGRASDAGGGMALGPKLAQRMIEADLQPAEFRVHAVQNLRMRPWGAFSKRLRGYVEGVAQHGGVTASDAEYIGVMNSIGGLDATYDDEAMGLSGHILPLFVISAVKPR